MLEAVDASADSVARVDDFQMCGHRNATRVSHSRHFFNQRQREPEIGLDHGGSIIEVALDRQTRFHRVTHDGGICWIGGLYPVNVRACQKQPRLSLLGLPHPLVSFDPRTWIANGRNSVR